MLFDEDVAVGQCCASRMAVLTATLSYWPRRQSICRPTIHGPPTCAVLNEPALGHDDATTTPGIRRAGRLLLRPAPWRSHCATTSSTPNGITFKFHWRRRRAAADTHSARIVDGQELIAMAAPVRALVGPRERRGLEQTGHGLNRWGHIY